MALSEDKKREYMRRLIMSRMRILCKNGFYGLLLMHMRYAIDEECETAATDGVRIYFGPDFLDELNDAELDFIMMHEILHCALQHCLRVDGRDDEMFNIACDIVVNSNILLSAGGDLSSITLKKYGTSMHLLPDGKEGCEYTAEQVYKVLLVGAGARGKGGEQGKSGAGAGASRNEGKAEDAEGHGRSSKSAMTGADGKTSTENRDGIDGKAGEGNGSDRSESGRRRGKSKKAADGLVAPSWDDHTHWGDAGEDEMLRDIWSKRVKDAAEAISIRDPGNKRGLMPLCVQRVLKELKAAQTDWRTILNDFVQEEIMDYSLMPPDRRFDDSAFFLPDFNERSDMVEDVLFMIDTSGSMSDDMITAAYSEVKGAIDQFNGHLKGWLGFFDAAIVEPRPFEDEAEFRVIKPAGGGGTDFDIIFNYVRDHMQDNPPVSIIILTDGYAPFPDETVSDGIPVLWLLNNETVKPPWGKVARIKVTV